MTSSTLHINILFLFCFFFFFVISWSCNSSPSLLAMIKYHLFQLLLQLNQVDAQLGLPITQIFVGINESITSKSYDPRKCLFSSSKGKCFYHHWTTNFLPLKLPTRTFILRMGTEKLLWFLFFFFFLAKGSRLPCLAILWNSPSIGALIERRRRRREIISSAQLYLQNNIYNDKKNYHERLRIIGLVGCICE